MKARKVGHIEFPEGRIFRKEYVGIGQCDTDLKRGSEVRQYEFVIAKEGVNEYELRPLLDEMFGHEDDDQSDLPSYMAIRSGGMIVVTGPEAKFYGDEVLAFWLPNDMDMSAIQADVFVWEKDKMP